MIHSLVGVGLLFNSDCNDKLITTLKPLDLIKELHKCLRRHLHLLPVLFPV